MSQQRSPFTHRRYPLTMVCASYRVARATVYVQTGPVEAPPPTRMKRGPKTAITDAALIDAMRQVLADSPFHGEGHRKMRVRLRGLGHRVGRNRVLRLMRAAGLLAPQRAGHPHGDPAHTGTITTERPNVMWGTDATRFYTERDGWCWWFGAIDHASDDIVGWHVAKLGDRWAALEPISRRRAPGPRDLRQGRRARSDGAKRLGPAVHRGCLRQRTGLAGDHPQPLVCPGAAMQRRDRALHPHAEGTVPLATSLRESRGGPRDHRRLHRAL